MHKTAITTWSDLEPLMPAYALIADVDLVVIRRQEKEHASVLYGRCVHRGALMAGDGPGLWSWLFEQVLCR